MESRASARTPRGHRHRGHRGLLTTAARLPQWAGDLYNHHRAGDCPRVLRQVLTALRSLVALLESRLEELEASEVQATGAQSAWGQAEW